MSLKDLSDAELAAFAKDPQKFLSDKENQVKVLGLDDPALKAKLRGQSDALKINSGLITNVVTQIPTIF
jgi:hypothetical protein